MGRSTNNLELVGSPGICEGPASRVRLLSPTVGTTSNTNHVIIPAETPLFVLIAASTWDNTACPLSAFTSNTADQLVALALEACIGFVTHLSCTIDGVPVAGLGDPINTIYYVVSPPFSYTTAEEGNWVAVFEGEPCLPGGLTVYPTEAVGVYLMLSPFSPGKHTIEYVDVGPAGTSHTIFDLTVTRDQGGDHDGGGR
jgi:hypothetical protein